jgi:Fe-Mn family superoxide dismutase
VDNLNRLTAGGEWEGKSLEDIVRAADGGVFNNAAQVWNHSFYWKCLSPDGGGDPPDAVAYALKGSFGDFASFKELFTKAAATHFGSGWAWLVVDAGGSLAIETTANAGCPLRDGKTPVLTCDVWEHAYYVDYRNARPKYVEAFWNLVNWRFVSECL